MDAAAFVNLVSRWAELMTRNRDWLIELDSVVGDSDLGLTMSDGFQAAASAVAESELTDVGKLAYQAGKAMASAVPSTMGTLMAIGLMNAGKALKGREELDAQGEADFFQAYLEGVQNRGKAALGEKRFWTGWPPQSTRCARLRPRARGRPSAPRRRRNARGRRSIAPGGCWPATGAWPSGAKRPGTCWTRARQSRRC